MPELIKPLLAVRLYSGRQAQDSGKQGVFYQIPLGSNVELTDDPCRLQGFSQVMCDGRLYATFADSLHDSVAASVTCDSLNADGPHAALSRHATFQRPPRQPRKPKSRSPNRRSARRAELGVTSEARKAAPYRRSPQRIESP